MSVSILPFLKRAILPFWNRGNRLAWRCGEYFDAIRRRRFEACVVCGRFAPMLYRRWVIPDELERRWGLSPRLAESLAHKESNDCAHCGAKLRVRRLAAVLLDLYPTEPPVRSVAKWTRSKSTQALRIAEINRVDGLHDRLRRLPAHVFSDFFEGTEPGEFVIGVRHEDLTCLTYPDESFDLIITSETLEHVSNLDRALAEIHRVLAPGGRHIFTIPLMPGVPETYSRMTRASDGRLTHHATPIFHPGGDRGYPVFTEFGLDVLERLRAAGFEAKMLFGPPTEDDLGQVFVSRKLAVEGSAKESTQA